MVVIDYFFLSQWWKCVVVYLSSICLSSMCRYSICLSSIGLFNLCLPSRWLSRNRLCLCLFGLRLDWESCGVQRIIGQSDLRIGPTAWIFRRRCYLATRVLNYLFTCKMLVQVPFQQCYILRYYFVHQWHSIITYNNAKFNFMRYPSNPNLVVEALQFIKYI